MIFGSPAWRAARRSFAGDDDAGPLGDFVDRLRYERDERRRVYFGRAGSTP